jgi:hypothetical protein
VSEQCRSDCRSPIAQHVRATSRSRRTWVAAVCADEEHLADALAVVRSLGFTVESVLPVVPAS